MKYFISEEENARYYIRPNIGIFKSINGARYAPTLILKGASSDFAMYRDDTTHIICSDKDNNIIYKQGDRPQFTVLSVKKSAKAYDFTLTSAVGFLDLFYKADFEGKTFLFHCILGSSQKPYIISQLNGEHSTYCFFGGKVYFTDKEKGFGYTDITQGKAKEHIKLGDCGDNPCAAEFDGKTFVAYTDKDRIFINDKIIISDRLCSTPLIFEKGGKLILQWRSGGLVKYIVSADGKIWSKPMQYITGHEEPCIAEIIFKGGNYRCYGSSSEPYSTVAANIEEELVEIKKQLQILKKEIKNLSDMNFFDKSERK